MVEKDNTKPDPEVPAQAKRRTFTAAFKLKMLQEVEKRQAAGQEIGSLLRRERLYSSAIRDWRGNGFVIPYRVSATIGWQTRRGFDIRTHTYSRDIQSQKDAPPGQSVGVEIECVSVRWSRR